MIASNNLAIRQIGMIEAAFRKGLRPESSGGSIFLVTWSTGRSITQ